MRIPTRYVEGLRTEVVKDTAHPEEMKERVVKLLRLLSYLIATSTFFLGALIRVIKTPDLIAGLYITCAAFYVVGIGFDTWFFINEWRRSQETEN